MLFEQEVGASWYVTAALPYYDQDLQSWFLAGRSRQHYLWVRDHEVDLLRKRPTKACASISSTSSYAVRVRLQR
jgi:hypothetical protein